MLAVDFVLVAAAAGFAAFFVAVLGAAFLGAPTAAFLALGAFLVAGAFSFFAAAGFLAVVEAGLGAAGSFLASFTVPEGPVAKR